MKEIKRLAVPAVDDNFAKTLGSESLEDLNPMYVNRLSLIKRTGLKTT